MGFRVGASWAALTILLSSPFLHGCATAPPAAQREPPAGYSVRFPATDPMEFEARPAAPSTQPELPPSDADETKGRWLRVIEVERNPRPAAPAPGEGSPPPAAPPAD